ncbi:unnamed protein product [Brugia timori]|uniref:Transposase n=1 Tax=Brugia timori TaxID=42155 RepID=A0A0R3Q983_9BILA|nr:unnamed protein product [Brugia timori]
MNCHQKKYPLQYLLQLAEAIVQRDCVTKLFASRMLLKIQK